MVTTGIASEKQLVGWIEKARIFPGGLVLPAKIDTGADNSSLNVPGYTLFDRDNEEWVRFTVFDNDGKPHEYERKLIRLAKIKRNKCPRQKRPVVMLGICVGKRYQEVEVNLVDRSKFEIPSTHRPEFRSRRDDRGPVRDLYSGARVSGSAC